MTVTVDEARRAYERALEHRDAQHRYIAEAQREVASRRAILPNLEVDVAHAKRNLDHALGVTVTPEPMRRREAQALVDEALHAARYPARALADPAIPHRYSGTIFGDRCLVGQHHDAGACGFVPGPEGITEETHVAGGR